MNYLKSILTGMAASASAVVLAGITSVIIFNKSNSLEGDAVNIVKKVNQISDQVNKETITPIEISNITINGGEGKFRLQNFEKFKNHGYGAAVCIARGNGERMVRSNGKVKCKGKNIVSLGDVLLYKKSECGDIEYYEVKDGRIYRIDIHGVNGINSIYTDLYIIPEDTEDLSNISFNIKDCVGMYDDVRIIPERGEPSKREWVRSWLDVWSGQYFDKFDRLSSEEINDMFTELEYIMLNIHRQDIKKAVISLFKSSKYAGKIVMNRDMIKAVNDLCSYL